MRVWDIDPSLLCRGHLLGEHREIHAIWTILTEDREGYREHPEVKRWRGHLRALSERHRQDVHEMEKRGWTGHASPLDERKVLDPSADHGRPEPITPLEEQLEILAEKDCPCPLD